MGNFEPVKVLFVGPSKEYTENRDYYNQVIVVSLIDGDTVNVLYADEPDFNRNDGDTKFYFVDPEHIAKAVSQYAIESIKDSTTINLIHDAANDTAIHSYSIGDYKKVMVNPKYIEAVKNNHPTLFGKVVRDTTHVL
ncbi:hypothetical protein F0919_15500 [Taibaiella lutea]|uniref:Uncharacterized protein n=1 Tax=Taibaiella lutea TaxID=2608001 RepID=A0A5M6CFI1_9BACT|nr:hypothetical protein [Taibaiella lutea]KAA5532205.1 hypothetical protein F0919_15500 [Taibaiella lutea]